MATQLATHYLAFVPLVSRVGPDARMLLLDTLDFSLDDTYSVDLTAVVQSAQLLHPIQSCFIDCSEVPYGVTVLQVFGSGQKIAVPPGAQGYYPLLIPSNAFVFTVTNGSNRNLGVSALVSLFFMNVPYVASQWVSNNTTLNPGTGGLGVGQLGGNPLGS